MCEINPDKLIKAVKSRPALYDKADSRYHLHKYKKGKIWKEVCRDVYPNWDQLRASHKVEYGLELQKRWKSLRTCFARELALQKKDLKRREISGPDDGPFRKRKKYEHFDSLTFLLNPEDREVADTADAQSDGSSSDHLEDNEIKIENFLDQDANEGSVRIQSVERNQDTFSAMHERSHESHSRNVEEKILDLLRDKKKEEEDDDRQFLVSLVPGFRKLNDKQKYEAKIEILKVLKNISFQEGNRESN